VWKKFANEKYITYVPVPYDEVHRPLQRCGKCSTAVPRDALLCPKCFASGSSARMRGRKDWKLVLKEDRIRFNAIVRLYNGLPQQEEKVRTLELNDNPDPALLMITAG